MSTFRVATLLLTLVLTFSAGLLPAENVFIVSFVGNTLTPAPISTFTGFSAAGASSASMSTAQPSPGPAPRRILYGLSSGAVWNVTPTDQTVGTSPTMTFTSLQNIGVYKIYVTKGQSLNASTNIIVTMTATGGDLSTTNGVGATSIDLDVFQRAKPNHVWVPVGYITNNTPNPTITFTHTGGAIDNNADATLNTGQRWYVDAVWFEYQDTCAGVAPQVSIAAPVGENQNFVNVYNVVSGATNVTVYADGAEIGQTNWAAGFAAGSLTVPTSLLAKGNVITAKQIKNGCHSLLPASGPTTGGGPNPQVRALLGMWQDASLAGPIGTSTTNDYTTTGTNYFLKATGLVGGSFGNAFTGGETLPPGTCWQTVTFTHGDPNYRPSGGAVTITDPYAALSGLAFSIDDLNDSGPYEIYVDRIMNGDVVIEDFEGAAGGAVRTFAAPNAATLPNPTSTYLSGFNASTISQTQAFDGTNSCKLQWQWADSSNIRWAHILANGAGSGKRYPQIDTTKPITVRYLVLTPGDTVSSLSFNSAPASQTKAPGDAVTFSVGARGEAPFTYQWKFEGSDIPTATTSTYSKSGLQSTDSGLYSVVVTSSGDAPCTATLDARLTVADAPPTLGYNVSGGQISFTWSGSFTLQSKTDLNSATWNDVTSTSGYSEALNSATAKFFRLRP